MSSLAVVCMEWAWWLATAVRGLSQIILTLRGGGGGLRAPMRSIRCSINVMEQNVHNFFVPSTSCKRDYLTFKNRLKNSDSLILPNKFPVI